MSAMGSVMVMRRSLLPLPAGLGDAGHLAGVHHLAQADAAQAEAAVHGARPAAAPAAGVRPNLELRGALGLLHEGLLGHQLPPRRNGKPTASSRARPSASVRAVVTMVMSMPRGASTLS